MVQQRYAKDEDDARTDVVFNRTNSFEGSVKSLLLAERATSDFLRVHQL